MVCSGCLLCLLAAANCFGADTITTFADFSDLRNRGYDGVFDALYHGGGIYLCTVANREVSRVEPMLVGFEEGRVTLSVSATLGGQPRQDVLLAYATNFNLNGGYRPMVWNIAYEQLHGTKKTPLLCVVVPGLTDPDAPINAGAKAAATLVVPLTSNLTLAMDDPKEISWVHLDTRNTDVYRAMQTISELFGAKNLGQQMDGIQKCLTDTQPMVRDFALQATVTWMRDLTPPYVVKIFQKRAAQYKDSSDAKSDDAREGIMVLDYIAERIFGRDRDTQIGLYRCVVALAGSPNRFVRDRAVADALAYRSLEGYLTDEEKAVLKNAQLPQ